MRAAKYIVSVALVGGVLGMAARVAVLGSWARDGKALAVAVVGLAFWFSSTTRYFRNRTRVPGGDASEAAMSPGCQKVIGLALVILAAIMVL